ncbi:MAG: hypothetical protein AMXMBFR53_17980 [Gemmatimonadota bacterium]
MLVFQGYADPLGRSGAELLAAWPTLAGVAEGVAAAGATVEAVVTAARDESFTEAGVAWRFVAESPSPTRAISSLARLAGGRGALHPARTLRATRSSSPDVVHLHGLSFPLQARALRDLHPGAALVAQDHADRPASGWRRWLHRGAYRGLDGVAFTAPRQALPFVAAGILPEGLPVYGVPEGSSRFIPGDQAAARAALGVSGAPAVGWIGRMTPGKDPLTALEAFRRAATQLPGATLWMASPGGPLDSEVRTLVSGSPDLTFRVRLLGPLPHDRVETLLRACDVFLSASRHEGSGYALVESLACGTPAAVTDIPPHVALVGPGEAGAIAPCGDPEALAAALAAVAARGTRARSAARRRFEEALTFEAIGRRLVQVYEDLLARRGRRPAPGAGQVAR